MKPSRTKDDDARAIDEALGIRTEAENGIVERYSCGCALVATRAGRKLQPGLFCGDEEQHARWAAKPEGEQGRLF